MCGPIPLVVGWQGGSKSKNIFGRGTRNDYDFGLDMDMDFGIFPSSLFCTSFLFFSWI